jgi:DNA-binding Lrp family transcriptional regulator
MKEITSSLASSLQGAGDRRMTVKEVAEALGVSTDTILNSIKELEAQNEKIRFGKIQGAHGGKPRYVLDESQATAIKSNLRKNSKVAAQPKTDIERRQIVEEAFLILREDIERLKSQKEALQIRLSEAEQWYSVKRVLIETGREYRWKPLKEYSRRHGYAVEKAFDKNYGEVNAYHTDVWNAVYGVEL